MVDPAGELATYYRAIGKLSSTADRTAPTHTTDMADRDECLRIAATHVTEGRWDEFYVKTIHRRRGVDRTVVPSAAPRAATVPDR